MCIKEREVNSMIPRLYELNFENNLNIPIVYVLINLMFQIRQSNIYDIRNPIMFLIYKVVTYVINHSIAFCNYGLNCLLILIKGN